MYILDRKHFISTGWLQSYSCGHTVHNVPTDSVSVCFVVNKLNILIIFSRLTCIRREYLRSYRFFSNRAYHLSMMRTDVSGKLIKVPNTEQQENIKNSRKTLKVLQQAATDKENLVGRAQRTGKELSKTTQNENLDSTETKKKKFVHKLVQTGSGLKIDVNDLTSEAGPSENYWEVIAEKRRIALDESLEENRKLHEENEALKEENRICKEMLDESRSLVEVLTEMLEEKNTSLDESSTSIETADETKEK